MTNRTAAASEGQKSVTLY
jgi:hypothetical protein